MRQINIRFIWPLWNRNLKEVAQEMMNQGLIQTYPEVVNIFEMSEITEIATEIMKLSGVLGNKKVTVVEELKTHKPRRRNLFPALLSAEGNHT